MCRYKLFVILALAFTCITRVHAASWNAMTYNSIRIAYFQRGDALGRGEADSFLIRAKNAQYNYILTPFYLQPGDTDDYIVIKSNFTRALQRADAFGLRLIPEIHMGDAHSDHWNNARLWNPNIRMVRFRALDGKYGCPSFANDPTGIDWTFVELCEALRDAFKQAAVSYPLEFFHVGHNEPTYYNRLIIGSCKTGKGMSSPYCGERQSWDIKTATETCAIDCNFINRFNGSKSEAVQSLVVGEVFRRMNQVQKVFGTKTKLMIFADMWDPMYFYQTVITWKNDTVRTAPGILSLPGLPDDSARARFRRNVILMPWTFQECAGPDSSGHYDAAATFSAFAANGFNFVYTQAFHTGRDQLEVEDVGMTRNWHDAALRFRQNCLGYAAVSWIFRYTHPPSPAFNIIESLYRANAADLPAGDFVQLPPELPAERGPH